MEEIYRYPTYYNIEYVDNGILEIRGELLPENGEIERDASKFRFISPETAAKFPRTTLLEGDIVLSVRGTMGKVGLIPKELAGANITANLIRLSPRKDMVSRDFLRWAFLTEGFVARLDASSPKTTIKTITVPALKAILLPLPPLEQQRAISHTLSTVRGAKKARQKELELERERKAALMQYLFTHGTRSEARKQTEIGEMPESWQVVRLGDIDLDISDGNYAEKYPRQSEFVKEGIPFIRANNIDNLSITWDDMKFISVEKHNQLRKGHLKLNDVLVTTRGEIGKIALVTRDFVDCNINAQIVRINAKELIIHAFFLYSLAFEKSQIQFKNLKTGSTLPQLPIGKLRQLKIGLPAQQEQKDIATVLLACDTKVNTLQRESALLDELFRAMLEELMTGRISTQPLIEF